ncbi:MAG: serine protease [Calditrichaeota bacterium]|nr:trypsin-like peptidase domain-containing protein [Calditrichota bacterium]RQV92847.1 MAG: serine protease [bacterium]RQW01700.1 MAG: serine protease [Calditrichota bacterium]
MKKFLISVIIFTLFWGCSRQIYEVAYPTLNDGKYDTEFPYKSCSAELNQISKTVRKLSSIAYYRSYIFPSENQVMVEDIQDKKFKKKAVKEIFYNNSVIGTATVISYSGRYITLLSCAHIIDFEDTVYTFYTNESRENLPFLQSVAFKEKQNNFIADFPEKGELEILAVDSHNDIALLGKRFSEINVRYPIPVFDYPIGKGENLEWGSFVYLLGYPKGYQMVTRGIVSQPDRDGNGSFLVDALFNRGFSGGIVLAIRDGVPNFELVGLASSAAADFDYTMAPPDDINRIGYDPRIPYEDEIYVRLNRNINYGITFIVSSELVMKFIRQNLDNLLEKGYDLSHLIR